MQTADVCVIGAGPAGCVVAARLAQLGFDVCLVERARFPRRRLGESLSPGVLPLLDPIGARDDVEAAQFTPVRSVRTNWDGAPAERVDPREQGLLVDRGRFDELLLARVRSWGARVLQPAVVRERLEDDHGWRLAIDADSTPHEVRVHFVVDATGRIGSIPGLRRRTGPRTVALFAYWTGERLPEQPRIEAAPDAWCWGVPLPGGVYNTLVFVDGAMLQGLDRRGREAVFHERIGRSGLMDGCVAPRIAGAVQATDATPYLDERPVTRNWIKVGDSALALDPLSSSGVQKAIQTALSGAVVVNTLLRKRECTDAAIRFYDESLTRASDRHRAWAAEHYATVAAREPGAFWTARSASLEPPAADIGLPQADVVASMTVRTPVQLSPDAELVDVPRLGCEFVALGPALRHPALDAPVAYLGGWELAPLLRDVRAGMTLLQLARTWSVHVPFESGVAIAGWMFARGILVGRP